MMRNLIHKPGTNCSAARRIWASGAESPSVAYAWGLFRDEKVFQGFIGRDQVARRSCNGRSDGSHFRVDVSDF
jgi:hypothetical protein